ncbi:hypothetical protein FA13DRAFT_1773345, partial [Coprinellus micaceus]
MKVTPIPPLMLCIFSSASANFHVGKLSIPSGYTNHRACPSNQYNCNCFKGGAGGSNVVELPYPQQEFLTYFQVQSGLCGMPLIDFYKRSDGSWEFYVNNGNGHVQGSCYSNSDRQSCLVTSAPFNATLTYED